jgi:leader peptidase (prepilin peptidase)/N-methyltransferase
MAEQTETKRESAGIGRSEPLRLAASVLLIGLWVANLLIHHSDVQKALGFVLIALLVHVAVTDIEERRIKNRHTIMSSVGALIIGLLLRPSGVPAQLLWGAGTGTFMMFFALISRGGLGMGDVKLGGVLGLYLSRAVIYAIAVGLLLAALFGVGVMVARGFREGRKTAIALGPFLAIGGIVAVLAGPSLHWGT